MNGKDFFFLWLHAIINYGNVQRNVVWHVTYTLEDNPLSQSMKMYNWILWSHCTTDKCWNFSVWSSVSNSILRKNRKCNEQTSNTPMTMEAVYQQDYLITYPSYTQNSLSHCNYQPCNGSEVWGIFHRSTNAFYNFISISTMVQLKNFVDITTLRFHWFPCPVIDWPCYRWKRVFENRYF